MKKTLIEGLAAVCMLLAAGLADAPAQVEPQEPPAIIQTVEAAEVEHIEPQQLWTEEDAEAIAKTIYGEAGSDWITTEEKAAVAWCILNRVDAGMGTVQEVVAAPHQFDGYNPGHPVTLEFYELAEDVLSRWQAEKEGAADVGRTLPADYLYFIGDGESNHFTIEWQALDTWDWSLPSPY